MPPSVVSRKSVIITWNIAVLLFNNQEAFGGIFVIIVEEMIAPGSKRTHFQANCRAPNNDSFDAERHALEFGRRGVEIGDLNRKRRVGGRMRFCRLKPVVFEGQLYSGCLFRGCTCEYGEQSQSHDDGPN